MFSPILAYASRWEGKIYSARAERVLPLALEDYRESLVKKFPAMADRKVEDLPPDVWLFRIGPRGS